MKNKDNLSISNMQALKLVNRVKAKLCQINKYYSETKSMIWLGGVYTLKMIYTG